MNQIYQFIKEVYTEVPPSIKITLDRLKSSEDFLKSVKILRNEGWRDWQILGAIKSISLSYRSKFYIENVSSIYEVRQILKEKSKQTEISSDISIPLLKFDLKELRTALIGGKRLLLQHYDFNNEDIEHIDIFKV